MRLLLIAAIEQHEWIRLEGCSAKLPPCTKAADRGLRSDHKRQGRTRGRAIILTPHVRTGPLDTFAIPTGQADQFIQLFQQIPGEDPVTSSCRCGFSQ